MSMKRTAPLFFLAALAPCHAAAENVPVRPCDGEQPPIALESDAVVRGEVQLKRGEINTLSIRPGQFEGYSAPYSVKSFRTIDGVEMPDPGEYFIYEADKGRILTNVRSWEPRTSVTFKLQIFGTRTNKEEAPIACFAFPARFI